MSSFKSLPTSCLPRERLLTKGATNLTHQELLAILLQTGYPGTNVMELANIILDEIPIHQFAKVTIDQLKSIKGLTTTKICNILAALELSTRVYQRFASSQPIIDSPKAAVNQLHPLRQKKREECHALYCNARHQLLGQELISAGSLSSTMIHARDVLEPALRYNASGVVIAHNHPSGDAEPSDEDLKLTARIAQACQIVGVELLDHLIITNSDFLSLRQRGVLQ